jgi:hypothetical protein
MANSLAPLLLGEKVSKQDRRYFYSINKKKSMKKVIQFAILAAMFVIWGAYLIYVWTYPSQVPVWVYETGFRKAFMLNRSFEPTIFTLFFGLGFTGMVLYKLFALMTGRASLDD